MVQSSPFFFLRISYQRRQDPPRGVMFGGFSLLANDWHRRCHVAQAWPVKAEGKLVGIVVVGKKEMPG